MFYKTILPGRVITVDLMGHYKKPDTPGQESRLKARVSRHTALKQIRVFHMQTWDGQRQERMFG